MTTDAARLAAIRERVQRITGADLSTAQEDREWLLAELTRLSAANEAIEEGLAVQKNTIASQQGELIGLYTENAARASSLPTPLAASLARICARALAATACDVTSE